VWNGRLAKEKEKKKEEEEEGRAPLPITTIFPTRIRLIASPVWA